LEKERRNNLRRVIHECRKLLEDEISKRLAYYGVMADGSFLDLAKLPHLTSEDWRTRQRIEQAIEKEMLGKLTKGEAVKRYINHVAFTYLNRLAALRAMEVRDLLKKQTIIRRDEYGGRSLRERDIAESSPRLTPEQVLRESLIQAFQEVGEEIKVLFDMNNEYSLVFPETRACLELIRLLTEEVAEDDWRQDDVIGWIYQYFNSEARKEFRKARRKPGADDIPVINQFYTPDWIVKALVDNTLGRLWLEMHSDSKIKGICTYFVPLKQKTSEREVKRVRDIKVLDPACGSGHFLVYAFDLLYHMYLEDEPDIPPSEVPAFILENNLFGIDIDLRSVQLAALSLYLKAKTRSRSLKIRGMNLVCADVRIADSEQRLGFLRRFEDDPALQHIFARLFEELEYTYEIGGLLKVRVPFERLFQERVSEKGRQARLSLPVTGQAEFGVKGLEGQTTFVFNKSQESSESSLALVIPKERTIEEMLDELRSFERESIKAQDMGRLLFATEAEKSVGLLSLLSQNYDAVVMNPPYGVIPRKCKEYVEKSYPKTHSDYYTAFIEQAINLCEPDGYVAALTGKTFMFLKSHQRLREEILRYYALPEMILDLGFNVLDEATARYAAFTLRKRYGNDKRNWKEQPIICFKLTDYKWDGKRAKFEEAFSEIKDKSRVSEKIAYIVKLGELAKLPGSPYSYWAPRSLRDLFQKFPPLDRDVAKQKGKPKIADVKKGMDTGDDTRFTRFWWEVNSKDVASSSVETQHKKWMPFAKGGRPFHFDVVYIIDWFNDGEDLKNYKNANIRNEQFYFQEGLVWVNKMAWGDISKLTPLKIFRLPKNTIFASGYNAIFTDKIWHLLAWGRSILNMILVTILDPNIQNVNVGLVAKLPVALEVIDNKYLPSLAREAYSLLREWETGNEISTQFILPWLLQVRKGFNPNWKPATGHPLSKDFEWSNLKSTKEIRGEGKKWHNEISLIALADVCLNREKMLKEKIKQIQKEIDEEIYSIYTISDEDRALIGHEPLYQANEKSQVNVISVDEHVERLLSYYVKKAIESDEDGIVPLDEMFPDNLFKKVNELIAGDFGADYIEKIGLEIRQILRKSLKEWIAQDYFDFHVSLYRRRPIVWELTSYRYGRSRGPPGVFSCFIHYLRLTRDTIPKIRAFYLERVKEALTREKEHLLRVLEAAHATGDGPRINRLSKVYENNLSKIDELERFEAALLTVHNPRKDKKVLPKNAKWVDRAIAEVRDNGWDPLIDYGVRVNIEPLKEAKLLHPAADRVK